MLFTEDYLRYPDGTRVLYRLNRYTKRINVVFVHGPGRGLKSYDYLFPLFNEAGIALHGVELYDEGLSLSGNADTRGFHDYSRDLKRFIASYLDNREVFLCGEGAGGLAALLTAADPRISVEALALISPPLDLRLNIFQVIFIHLLGLAAPGASLPIFKDRTITGDSDSLHEQNSGQKTFRPVYSAGFLKRIFDTRRDIFTSAGTGPLCGMPLLLMLAQKDYSRDNEAIERSLLHLLGDSGMLTVISEEDAGPVPLLEAKREVYAGKIISWIKEVIQVTG